MKLLQSVYELGDGVKVEIDYGHDGKPTHFKYMAVKTAEPMSVEWLMRLAALMTRLGVNQSVCADHGFYRAMLSDKKDLCPKCVEADPNLTAAVKMIDQVKR